MLDNDSEFDDPLAGEVLANQDAEFTALTNKVKNGPALIIGIVSGKTSSGKSTLAANIACLLNRDFNFATALLDLDLQFGDQSLMFDAPPTPSIIDVVANADSLTPEFIIQCMHQGPNIKILTSPSSPELADLITPIQVKEIIRSIRPYFDAIIIDTGSYINDTTVEVLDASDAIILLTTPSLLSLKNNKLILKLFRDLEISPTKIHGVLNRVEPGLKMPLENVAAILKFPLSIEIPHSPAQVIESAADGKPLVLTKPTLDFSRAIAAVVQSIAGDPNATPKPQKKGLLGFGNRS
jgi:pilus assembly protein CpaE